MSEPKSLRVRALELLARREHSRVELERKLAPHAESAEELEAVLDECAERRWQSDRRFAEMLVGRKAQKLGRLRLRQELAAKGVDAETIGSVLPDAGQERAHAALVLQKRYRQPPQNFQDKQKRIRFLLYRGFSMDTALAVVQADDGEIWDAD